MSIVLDLAREGYSICGKIMGDLWSDVLKIEDPRGGSLRNIGLDYVITDLWDKD